MSNENQTKQNQFNGRWTKLQHHRFLEGVQLYGRNWQLISKHVGTRNGAQIRSHAQKYFNKIQKQQANNEKSVVMSEKLSSTCQFPSAPQQETNISFSYYFSTISKFMFDYSSDKFWQEFISVSSKQSRNNLNYSNDKFKNSFTPYLGQIHNGQKIEDR